MPDLIRVDPVFSLTPHGLGLAHASRRPTIEQAGHTLQGLVEVLKALRYWIGDAANLTEGLFGEEAAQVLDAGLMDLDLLRELRRVAERVPAESRELAPTWDHAKAVATLKPKAQAKFLQLALDEDWSVAKLKAEAQKSLAPDGAAEVGYVLVVRCKSEEQQRAVKDRLEMEGLPVTARVSTRKAKAEKPPKEVTAKGRKGSQKMYTRRRPPQ